MPLQREKKKLCPALYHFFGAMLQNIMISLFSGTHAAEENESFCYIYHLVLIEEMCLCPHLRKEKRNTSKIYFFSSILLKERKKTRRVKSGVWYFCQGLSRGGTAWTVDVVKTFAIDRDSRTGFDVAEIQLWALPQLKWRMGENFSG